MIAMKKIYPLTWVMVAFLMLSCSQRDPNPAAEKTEPQFTSAETTTVFMAQYEPYCGNTYAGRSVFVDLGDESPLIGARLLMTVAECSVDEIRIPFYVDEDRSRTWILSYQDGALRLGHDHRYDDGSEYEANFYGGFAMENENGHFQYFPEYAESGETVLFFPSDERTIADRAARNINVWSKAFDTENQRYYYRLYLEGRLRYEAEFDLSEVVSQ
jgi:hypothetical protein